MFNRSVRMCMGFVLLKFGVILESRDPTAWIEKTDKKERAGVVK